MNLPYFLYLAIACSLCKFVLFRKEIQLEVEKKEKLDEIAELERKLAKAKAAANEMSPHSERAPGDSLSQQVAASPTGVTVNINVASATLTESVSGAFKLFNSVSIFMFSV